MLRGIIKLEVDWVQWVGSEASGNMQRVTCERTKGEAVVTQFFPNFLIFFRKMVILHFYIILCEQKAVALTHIFFRKIKIIKELVYS